MNKSTTNKNPAAVADQKNWASVPTARAHIMANLSSPITEGETVPLWQALGRVLAADIAAPFNVPGHDNSAMDGYACRLEDLDAAADTPLKIIGAAFAGAPYLADNKTLPAKTCVRIMTGAPIPAGADVIVPQEETQSGEQADSIIILNGKRQCGLHIRQAGEDLRADVAALHKGDFCRPAHIGLLASLGLAEVSVFRKLRVAFFSTGDELKTAGTPLQTGDVYDSNRHSIAAMLSNWGFDGIDLGVVADSPQQLSAVMDKAAQSADVIIASGGASVGEADYIRQVLAERGEVLFWKVSMRPGRPLAYGKVGKVASECGGEVGGRVQGKVRGKVEGGVESENARADFFGLPGNPVSVMVCFYQFVLPALWQRAGRQNYLPPPLFGVRTGANLKKSAGRTEYQRGILRRNSAETEWSVYPTGEQGSGILSSMTAANCFIVLESERGSVEVGDIVQVQMFEGLE